MNVERIFLKNPCANCPFLKVGAIMLAPGRVEEIAREQLDYDDRPFMCHKTLELETKSYCVGAMVFLLKAERPHMGMRLGVMLRMFDPATLLAKHQDAIIEPEAYE